MFESKDEKIVAISSNNILENMTGQSAGRICCWSPYTPYCILFAHLMCFAGVEMLPRFLKKKDVLFSLFSHFEAGGKPWQHHLYQKHRRSTGREVLSEMLVKRLHTKRSELVIVLFCAYVLSLDYFRPKLTHRVVSPRPEVVWLRLVTEIELHVVHVKHHLFALCFTCTALHLEVCHMWIFCSCIKLEWAHKAGNDQLGCHR